MALTVPAQIARAQRLPVPRERAFELLLDLPAWAALFPRVDTIEPLDGHAPDGSPGDLGAYLWTMTPMGPPGLEMATVYACRYTADRDAGRLVWEPVEGVGNARFSGEARLSEHDVSAPGAAGCDLDIHIDAELEIPAPRLLRRIVETAVHFEFGRTVDTFLDNVAERLAEGV